MSIQEVCVETENLTRRFGRFVAVDRVSIKVYRGEIFGFLGANGAGKTTMIRMLCGLLRPSAGRGSVAGLDIHRQSEQIKRNIGYMSQRFSLYEDLTVEENIQFYGGLYGLRRRDLRGIREDMLSRFGLEGYRHTLTADVPLGFKQRLALGCAMLNDPPVLFLDEPTSGVDPRARRNFWDRIHQTAAAGTTVFVTTHFMEEAEYCDRVSIMDAGRMIAPDTPGNLKGSHQKPTMQAAFVSLIRKEIDHSDV